MFKANCEDYNGKKESQYGFNTVQLYYHFEHLVGPSFAVLVDLRK
jgi:hypothetical protein